MGVGFIGISISSMASDPPDNSFFFISMIVFVGIMYFFLILPQRRKEKKTREMIESLRVGFDVTTIGGIAGRVININDEEITIETGVEKTKLLFKRWAIREIITQDTENK